MKVCRYTGYSEITQAAKNAELFSSRNGLTNLGQRSSLLGQFKLRHLWPLLRQTKLIGRAAWSHARRNHGRFAGFSDTEIAGSIWMILGGYIGTGYLLSSAHYFDRNPLARKEFLANPDVRSSAVEELLRYFTPGTQSQRLITGPCVAGGERYEGGDVAILDWAAGNFDERVFVKPGEIDFNRPHIDHLTFGAGAHYCLGAEFAREFVGLFLLRFLQAFPRCQIDATKSVRLQYSTLAGFETLPADLAARPREAVASYEMDAR